jgi:hypothetical protein
MAAVCFKDVPLNKLKRLKPLEPVFFSAKIHREKFYGEEV